VAAVPGDVSPTPLKKNEVTKGRKKSTEKIVETNKGREETWKDRKRNYRNI
jgi:hypothetical protein